MSHVCVAHGGLDDLVTHPVLHGGQWDPFRYQPGCTGVAENVNDETWVIIFLEYRAEVFPLLAEHRRGECREYLVGLLGQDLFDSGRAGD